MQEGARGSEKERERRKRKGSELSFSAPEADTFADTRHDHPLGVPANLSMEISRARRGRRRLGAPPSAPLRGRIVNPRGLATWPPGADLHPRIRYPVWKSGTRKAGVKSKYLVFTVLVFGGRLRAFSLLDGSRLRSSCGKSLPKGTRSIRQEIKKSLPARDSNEASNYNATGNWTRSCCLPFASVRMLFNYVAIINCKFNFLSLRAAQLVSAALQSVNLFSYVRVMLYYTECV